MLIIIIFSHGDGFSYSFYFKKVKENVITKSQERDIGQGYEQVIYRREVQVKIYSTSLSDKGLQIQATSGTDF